MNPFLNFDDDDDGSDEFLNNILQELYLTNSFLFFEQQKISFTENYKV